MDVQFAEVAAERQMLLRRQMLIAEEDHGVLGQCSVDLVHLAVRGRSREIGAADFRADDRRELIDRDRFVRRRLVREVPISRSVVSAQ
jgi:hypothetical protein